MRFLVLLAFSLILTSCATYMDAVVKEEHVDSVYSCINNDTGKTIVFRADTIKNAKMIEGKVLEMDITTLEGIHIQLTGDDLLMMTCYLRVPEKKKKKKIHKNTDDNDYYLYAII